MYTHSTAAEKPRKRRMSVLHALTTLAMVPAEVCPWGENENLPTRLCVHSLREWD